ncbi:MerR family transcriptional regulator [Saccharopolyspora shandongensis]|uniref:MerR family transcriptional regulator n=1 Tax=Saccharopolyspora shandongensis TaxID=418495 RepID=UPI0034165849
MLPAERTPAGYRVYGEDTVDRLAFSGAAKDLGLSLEEISELLEVWESALTSLHAPERAGQWQQLLSGAGREEIDDGMRLVAPAERTGQLATLAAAEQQCCPFFDFRLHLDGPVLRLEVRATAEGAALLTELFAPTA